MKKMYFAPEVEVHVVNDDDVILISIVDNSEDDSYDIDKNNSHNWPW